MESKTNPLTWRHFLHKTFSVKVALENDVVNGKTRKSRKSGEIERGESGKLHQQGTDSEGGHHLPLAMNIVLLLELHVFD